MLIASIKREKLEKIVEETAILFITKYGEDWLEKIPEGRENRRNITEEKWVWIFSTTYLDRLEITFEDFRSLMIPSTRIPEPEKAKLERNQFESIISKMHKIIDTYSELRVKELGLSDLDIKSCQKSGRIAEKRGTKMVLRSDNKIEVYNQLMLDPYLFLGLLPEKAHRIARGFKLDHRVKYLCCYIVYELEQLCKTGKHVCYPLDKFLSVMPDLRASLENGLKEVLKQRYGCEIRDGYIYFCYQIEVEKFLTELFAGGQMEDWSDLYSDDERSSDGDEQWFDPHSDEDTLNDLQRLAQEKISVSKVCVLTGGPGTGKTYTIQNTIMKLIKNNINYFVLTPTGKAALNLSSSDKTILRTMTCHKFLASLTTILKDLNKYGDKKKGYIIFDESSMLTNSLVAHVCAVLPRWRFVFVGDPDQLQPIGPGNFFNEVIKANTVPVIRLETIYRQKEGSYILDSLDQIRRKGRVKLATSFTLEEKDKIRYLLQERDKRNVKIICPTWKDVKEMNELAREVYVEDTRKIKWKVGTMVMVTKNFYGINNKPIDIMNGTEGEVLESNENYIVVKFTTLQEPIVVEYEKYAQGDDDDEDDDIPTVQKSLKSGFSGSGKPSVELTTRYLKESFAITVHSAQGSGWDTVIFYSTWWPNAFVNRPLVYTAFSRAKEKLYSFTRPGFLNAFSRIDPIGRHDNTKYRLNGETPVLINPCPEIQQCKKCKHYFEHCWKLDECLRCRKEAGL